jgi:hypothetical protein
VVPCLRQEKRKRLLFISTLFPIHAIAGPPFRETRPQYNPDWQVWVLKKGHLFSVLQYVIFRIVNSFDTGSLFYA